MAQIRRNELTLVKQIGEGGYSSVYQMTWLDPSLGPIDIAAKRLNKRDVHELEIMSNLNHTNIVKLLGVVDEDIDFMLIMELCDRGSLRSFLQDLNGKRLSDDQFYDWAEQAARPLEYLREQCVVHKDVKSPNYMITADNNLKLGDFGIAKNIVRTIDNATETASYPWMAPELLKDNILSPKYDIFAYGVVVWELRTGKIPFDGLEAANLIWIICHENQRLPIPEDCPEAMKHLMRNCWKSDWKKRPCIKEVIAVIEAEVHTRRRQQQIITGQWKLETEFAHQSEVWGIAVNPHTKHVAIADFATSKVKVYSRSTFECKFSMDTTRGLDPEETSYPFQVTTNAQGTTYFVTDLSDHVKCFNSRGQFEGQWVSSCPQASSSSSPFLDGLAMDHDENLLVVDFYGKHINKHTQDGSYVNSIKVGIEPMHIAVTSKNTVVVAGWDKPPQIVSSKTGEVLCILRHPDDESQWDPRGIACFEDIILIANCKTQNVLCFSDTGSYLGNISVPGMDPTGIATTTDGAKLSILVCDFKVFRVYSTDYRHELFDQMQIK